MATLPPVSSSVGPLQSSDSKVDSSSRPDSVPVWRAPGFGAISSARSTVAGAAASSGGTPIRRNYANDAEREQRLLDFGIKPLPKFTFEEIKQTQRDVLRVIAMVYDAPRGRTRADLELSLAEKLAAYHPGDPNYDLSRFEASEPKRLGNNYVQRQLLGPRPFVMDGAFADMAGRGSGSRRATTAVAAAAAAAQTGVLRFPAAVTGADRQVDRASLRLAQLIPNLQFPAGIAAARAMAVEPESIRSGVLHLPEPEGDILMGLHPSSHAAYRWCGRCGTDVSTRFHNWYLHILKCDPIFYQNELTAFFASRAGAGTPVLPPFGFPGGVKMSVAEEQHALASRAKYMAALNGLGPETVRVLVNAAMYFKAFGDPNEILERVEAVSRWMRNETLLRQILGNSKSNRAGLSRSDPSPAAKTHVKQLAQDEIEVAGRLQSRSRPSDASVESTAADLIRQAPTRYEPETRDYTNQVWMSSISTQRDHSRQREMRTGWPGSESANDPNRETQGAIHSTRDADVPDSQPNEHESFAASPGDEQRYGRMMHQIGLARSMEEVMEIKSEFERAFGARFEPKLPLVRKRPEVRQLPHPSRRPRLITR